MDEGEASFDDAFVAAAPVRESDLHALPKPSRESLREVKREARQRRRARRPKSKVRGVAVVAVVAALGGGGLWYAGSHGPARPLPARAEREPVVVPSYSPPPSKPVDPFSGTAVAAWPVGAAGIKPPAPKPVGAYGTAQVADAYARTVRYLRAAMLDRAVLWNGGVAPVDATLAPASARRYADDPSYLANRFPRSVRPASPSVRVNGEMAAKPGPRGVLRVEFSYVATYAVRPAKGGPTELVAIRRYGTFEYERATAATVTAPWAYEVTYIGDHAPCGAKNRFPGYLEVVLDSARTSARPVEPHSPYPSFDVLDPRAPLPPEKTCFTNTGKL
jgi:hypothetical protein